MTTNQDIMAFLKKAEEAREKEKEEDLIARAQERKEDMQKIADMITTGVKNEVNRVLKPLEERLAEQEAINTDMGRQLNKVMGELEALRRGASVYGQDFPLLSYHSEHEIVSRGSTSRHEGGFCKEEEEVKVMCADARKVIGLTPIEPRMLELQMQSFGAKDKEEAMLMEVKSYLKCEMKMRPSEIEKLDIVRVFHPAKENWNVLYIELGSESQVDQVFSYTRVMEKKDHRVTRWIPRRMYERFSALQNVAYHMRKNDNVKTRVKIGQSDLELSIREQGSSFWRKCQLPENLPKIGENLLSSPRTCASPPPGRPGRPQGPAVSVTDDRAVPAADII